MIAAALLLVFIAVVAAVLFSDWHSAIPADATATYVGRQNCITCHQEQAAAFHGSYHDLAMDYATPESVLASFDGQEIEHHGVTSRVFRRDEKYFVNTEGPDGNLADFEVKYVFGDSPLQQYMVELQPPTAGAPAGAIGRVQVLRLSWDTNKQEWFYLSPPDVDEKLDPDDPLHWTGITQCWNSTCADCHSTDLKANFDVDTLTYASTFSEIDVSCEACHGPGSLHVEIAEDRKWFWDRNHGTGLTRLKGPDTLPQIETCAKCHARRAQIHDSFQPGQPFHDSYVQELLTQQSYHADGQIKDEDYVYGSFLQSKMFHKGIRCSDCHDPHSTRVLHEGNKLCTSCHQHPAQIYDSPAHHFHKDGSTGASCVECHMPETTYMSVDPRRDHSIRVPRPDLSVKLGTPNACTQCHLDEEKLPAESREGLKQYLDWILKAKAGDEAIAAELKRLDQWSLDAVNKWYGEKETPEHFSEIFVDARNGNKDSIDKLNDLIRSPEVPDIVRATAVSELNRFPGEQPLDIAIDSLDDRDEMVVSAAIERVSAELRSMAIMAAQSSYAQSSDAQSSDAQESERAASNLKKSMDRLLPLIHHPVRLIRTQAARAIVSLPESILYEHSRKEDRLQLEDAIDEFVESQMVSADRERAHIVVGGMYEERGDFEKAIEFYRNAIRVYPQSTVARRNLAAVLENKLRGMMQSGQQMAQRGDTKAAMRLGPQIGKLEEEVNRLRAEELAQLKIELVRIGEDSSAAALYYQYATSSYLAGDLEQTEKYFLKAAKLEPTNARFQLALAYLYQKLEKWDKAFAAKNKLLEIDPKNPDYLALEQELLEATRSRKP